VNGARDVQLAAGEVLSLAHPRGIEVSVLSGCVWITEESRTDDIWLCTGERTSLGGDGLAVIEAIGAANAHFALC
jgi:hypothetical protein